MPTMLERNIDFLCMLGEPAGPSCMHLVTVLFQCDAVVENVLHNMRELNSEQWAAAVMERMDGHLTVLDTVIAKCKRDVRPLIDREK